MTRILLTGAGFSRNWGGWLANEAFEYLIGSTHLTPHLRNQLWADKKQNRGFEETLAALQGVAGTKHGAIELQGMQAAVRDMFGAMNRGFFQNQIEVNNQTHLRLVAFLKKFDAIFSLNQDLLLEHIYCNPFYFCISNIRNWDNCKSPGVQIADSSQSNYPENPLSRPHIPSDAPFNVEDNSQPYFKLHGSSNWHVGDEDNGLLVMGGGKEIEIGRHQLLTWYNQQFKTYMSKPDCKLMVIGYSFNDPHINKPIVDAVRTGLKLFIIDPAGVDVLDKTPPNQLIPGKKELIEYLEPGLIGASRRTLHSIFGDDRVEHGKLDRFMALGNGEQELCESGLNI